MSRQDAGTPSSRRDRDAPTTFRHDVNNLLFVIVGSADGALKRVSRVAERGDQDAQAALADLERILLAAERVQETIQRFLSASDSDAQAQESGLAIPPSGEDADEGVSFARQELDARRSAF